MENSYNTGKRTKLRFFGLYLLGLVLIFVVVSSFWKKKQQYSQQSGSVSEKEILFMQLDTTLHTRLEQVDALYADFIKNRQDSTSKNEARFLAAKNSFLQTLDSIDFQAANASDEQARETMKLVSGKFRNTFGKRYDLVTDLAVMQQPSATTAPASASSSQDVAQLRQLLEQKNKEIAALQQAASQNPSQPVVTTNTGNGEWKQKYNSLKSAYDKVAENEKALKNAYKTVADDNRRLMGQLQLLRKG